MNHRLDLAAIGTGEVAKEEAAEQSLKKYGSAIMSEEDFDFRL